MAKTRAAKQPENSKPRRKPTAGSWRPGQSGNPAGRPPTGHALAEVLREFLDEPMPDGRSRKQRLVERLFGMAVGKAGSIAAARLIFEQEGTADVQARLASLEARLDAMTGVSRAVGT